MNIYDPPMKYEPLAAWVAYLDALKADSGDHAEEIERTITVINEIMAQNS